MKIDVYSPCPGGTGKKIKFCCSDLVSELDKASRMIDGEQFQACLDHLNRVDARFPGRQCVLTDKAMLELHLDRKEELAETVRRLRELHPDNPNGLAMSAMIAMREEQLDQGIELLSKAIAASTQGVTPHVMLALRYVTLALYAEGRIPAFLAHANVYQQLSGDDETIVGLFGKFVSAPDVSPLLKDRPHDPLGDVSKLPSKDEFEVALAQVWAGDWWSAREGFTRLAEQAPDAPAVWQYLARVRLILADEAGAVAALRRLAALDVPPDDAVEAEALAQILDPAAWPEVDLVQIEYTVNDAEQAERRLSASRSFGPMDLPDSLQTEEYGPPPRSSFAVFNRPLPASGIGLAMDDVPELRGNLSLFGRQTDRPARIELAAYRDELADATSQLAACVGDALGPPGAEQVVGSAPLAKRVLVRSWNLPHDTPADHARALMKVGRRRVLFEAWPALANPLFEGRTAAQAAADPTQRVKLLAAILQLELAHQVSTPNEDLDALRSQVGLPVPHPIDPASIDIKQVPLVRLSRLMVDKLSDGDLLFVFDKAFTFQVRGALYKLAREVLARTRIHPDANLHALYTALALTAATTTQALDYVRQGRAALVAAGKSCGLLDVDELALCMTNGLFSEIMPLIEHIVRVHTGEPDVRSKFFQLLHEAGLIDDDGKLHLPVADQPEPEIAMPGEATSQRPGIWTPHSAEVPGRKSAIWTPGSD
ncbi:MAG: hypothetical protein WD847_12790 [Pirellulales bacterium]